MCCSTVVHFNTCEVCTCAVQWLYTSIHVTCVHVLFNGCTHNTCEMCTCVVPQLYTSIHVRYLHVLVNGCIRQYM